MTSARQKSYLFALLDGGGTVRPELGAARRLVKRGHRVEVLADDSMLDSPSRSISLRVSATAAPKPAAIPQ